MEIFKCYQTENACYKRGRKATQTGILVHSTGAVNRELRRYVDAPERLGKNQYNNHWNKSTATKCVHAFIGYDKDKNIIVAETLPHDIACWGSGSGKNGSYNRDPKAHIQFEICQGSNTDAAYYWAAIGVAEEYCAHLCSMYGWSADKITSHKEAAIAGYASNHGDPQSWMRHFCDDMDKFRERVAMRLNGTKTPVESTEEKDEQEPAQEVETPTAGKIEVKTVVVELQQIKNGSKCAEVKTAQRILNALGYDCGTVDGIFGARTDSAVKAFQKAKGLTADGIVGAKTWAALLK